ncbi:ABC transporter ATP-binding protein [Demequina sp. B12]|uniref:ABC transporter ATP-binding protein n=1 Tax=Demequina sp. B12 TaxID=2992757 RepID=UPI00237A583C|nr:ABC transporter ATP-binding protein [Demequina sp. B12]MDE0573175.1 ABC transporter ATP-binding protein [Demequina sp. B12]
MTEVFAEVAHEPGAAKQDPIVIADHVHRHFGGLTAVDVEHFEVQRNAITALIGPNGAGKSTFFNLLTGFDRPQRGEWQFNGHSLVGTSPAKIARAGKVRTFQLTKALNRMTVMENMRLGAAEQGGENFFKALVPGLWKAREQEITEKAHVLLHRFKLYEKKDDYAGSLSGGQRKLLEMARALMSDPEMIMLDEPMAGVNPALTESLLDHVVELKNEGKTILFVEHDMHMVRRISDWVVVMAEGRIIAEGPPQTVMANPAVQDAYLGAHHDSDLSEEDPS